MADADTLKAWLSAAVEHHEAQEFEQARDLYLKVLEADPTNMSALQLSGLMCLQIDELDAAESLFKLALDADPGNVKCTLHLGTSKLKRGDFVEAIEYFTAARQLDLATDPLLNMGIACGLWTEINKSIDFLNKHTVWIPATCRFALMGIVCRDLGEFSKRLGFGASRRA